MIKTILATTLAFSSSIALAGIKECSPLMGEYTTSGESRPMPLTITAAAEELTLNLSGSIRSYIVDGIEHQRDSIELAYIANCTQDGLQVHSTYDGQQSRITTVKLTKTGIEFSVLPFKDGKQLPPMVLPADRN